MNYFFENKKSKSEDFKIYIYKEKFSSKYQHYKLKSHPPACTTCRPEEELCDLGTGKIVMMGHFEDGMMEVILKARVYFVGFSKHFFLQIDMFFLLSFTTFPN